MSVKILIADDHEFIRDGVKMRIERHLNWVVCGEATNGREAVEMAAGLQPDIAVLDVGMPERNGLEAAALIKKASPKTELLILSMQESEDLVWAALSSGVLGFILKTDAARLLIVAIETVLDHQPFFNGKVSALVLRRFLDRSLGNDEATGPYSRLTSREREVVRLLADARTSKEVAARLNVSVKTVDAHRANIMRKLEMHSTVELVRYAVRNHLVQP